MSANLLTWETARTNHFCFNFFIYFILKCLSLSFLFPTGDQQSGISSSSSSTEISPIRNALAIINKTLNGFFSLSLFQLSHTQSSFFLLPEVSSGPSSVVHPFGPLLVILPSFRTDFTRGHLPFCFISSWLDLKHEAVDFNGANHVNSGHL